VESFITDESGNIELPVVCATRDFQGAVAETIVTMWNVLWTMKRSPVYCQFQSHGYAFVRAGVFMDLKKSYGRDLARGFMIDDDILLKSDMQKQLAIAIKTADEFGWNFISPYRTRDGFTSIAKANGDLMNVEEVRSLRPFDRVPNGGLGFYYGDLPLSYRFHEDGIFGGEDLNFFHENPQLEIRCVDLNLQHLKTVNLTLNTPILMQARPMIVKETPVKTAEEVGLKPDEHPRLKE
jgi:hypothetical protein